MTLFSSFLEYTQRLQETLFTQIVIGALVDDIAHRIFEFFLEKDNR